MMEKLKTKRFLKKANHIFLGITMGVFFLAVGLLAVFFITKHLTRADYRQIKRNTSNDGVQLSDGSALNFDLLIEKNAEIYAYIDIVGTDISYPILKNQQDDDYYKTHSMDKLLDSHGAIHTEKYNSDRFTERNTVIYGNTCVDNTMFSQLWEYKEKQYCIGHENIKLYTLDLDMEYQLFMVCQFDDRDIMNSYDFTSYSGMQSYLSDLEGYGQIYYKDDKIFLDSKTVLITLSTEDNASHERLVVLAVKKTDED